MRRSKCAKEHGGYMFKVNKLLALLLVLNSVSVLSVKAAELFAQAQEVELPDQIEILFDNGNEDDDQESIIIDKEIYECMPTLVEMISGPGGINADRTVNNQIKLREDLVSKESLNQLTILIQIVRESSETLKTRENFTTERALYINNLREIHEYLQSFLMKSPNKVMKLLMDISRAAHFLDCTIEQINFYRVLKDFIKTQLIKDVNHDYSEVLPELEVFESNREMFLHQMLRNHDIQECKIYNSVDDKINNVLSDSTVFKILHIKNSNELKKIWLSNEKLIILQSNNFIKVFNIETGYCEMIDKFQSFSKKEIFQKISQGTNSFDYCTDDYFNSDKTLMMYPYRCGMNMGGISIIRNKECLMKENCRGCYLNEGEYCKEGAFFDIKSSKKQFFCFSLSDPLIFAVGNIEDIEVFKIFPKNIQKLSTKECYQLMCVQRENIINYSILKNILNQSFNCNPVASVPAEIKINNSHNDKDDESSNEEHDVVADAVVDAIGLGVRGVQRLRDAAPEKCTIS